ncbi:hypothetical protein GTQ40_04990 [Flavobacteriaceae bacterium R38]|nr:hypothetical protein [Flavobacteriaceae bacterium R38]
MKKKVLIAFAIIAVLGFILGIFFKISGIDGNGIILGIAILFLIVSIFLKYKKDI